MKTGTLSREGRYVKGDCERAGCPERDVLVYLVEADDTLVCAGHMRAWMEAHPRKEVCDRCGDENAWRDPLTRRNEFFCAKCHGENGTVFQNRWANRARESKALGLRDKVVCDAAGKGTECRGEIKYRTAMRMSLCNKHAGKQGVGPNG